MKFETIKINSENITKALTTVLNELEKETENIDINYLKENNIDVDSSLDFLGDMETYNETLRDFLIENKTRIPKMKEHLSNEDASNYAILAHALKSDSKYLGFKKLAELSLDHELKGKESDIKYIENHYEELITEVNRVLGVVKKYLKGE